MSNEHPATNVRPGKRVRQILTGASRHEGWRGEGFVNVEVIKVHTKSMHLYLNLDGGRIRYVGPSGRVWMDRWMDGLTQDMTDSC